MQSDTLRARRRNSPLQRGRAEDSWIDISSQPSVPDNPRSTSVAGSSQDEYEESESESDRVLSSSNEDEDETSTALGVTEQHVFTPQPNAFSHPPSTNSNVQSTPAPTSYFPPAHVTYSDRLPSNRIVTRRSQPDHDAALRASLTTLLSCAAAVRPKQPEAPVVQRPPLQPRSFRLVPESEMDAPAKPMQRRRSRESSKERQAKKMRAIRAATNNNNNDDLVSPTMMTWMISAGVVLVVSAISFSAGYAWGKDAGLIEGELNCNSCGKEVIKGGAGLRKLRFTQSVRA